MRGRAVARVDAGGVAFDDLVARLAEHVPRREVSDRRAVAAAAAPAAPAPARAGPLPREGLLADVLQPEARRVLGCL